MASLAAWCLLSCALPGASPDAALLPADEAAWAVDAAGLPLDTLLTPEDGNHDITLSPSGQYFTDSYSKPDVPPIPHPADFLDALKIEFPEATIDELVTKADIRVAAEVLKRKATQTESTLTIETIPEGGDDEVPDSPAA